MKRIAYFILVLILFHSCKNEPIFPIEPKIEFISVEPAVIQDFGDVEIKLSYTDGDGDLGNEEADSTNFNLFLKDLRPGLPINGYDGILKYNIPNLTTDTKKPSIQGTININVLSLLRLQATKPADTLAFEIWIQDRAGNISNTIQTKPIIILP